MDGSVSRRGFTLIELLTALAVLSVVTTIGSMAFISMTTAWRDTTAGMELNAKSVAIFDSIRADTSRVPSAHRTGQGILGIDRLETEATINRHIPQDDRIVLPVSQRTSENTEPRQHVSVMYSIDREGGVPKLVRTVGGAGEQEPSGASQVIAEEVYAMNITYLGSDNTWSDEWSGAELPVAVRVSLSMALKGRPYDQISREATFPIHVK